MNSPASENGAKIIRVVLCSYPGIFADTVIKALQEVQNIELVGLVYSQRIFSARENWSSGALRLIKTAGFSYAVLQFLQTDLYVLLRKISCTSLVEKSVSVYATKNINTESGLDFLRNLKPDVILLANFNQKVCPPLISLPHLACLNIHPSLLPKFKGVDPVFAALLADESCLGVTVHLVAEEFDSGAILAQTEIQTDKQASVFYHQFLLFQQGAKLAAQIIVQLPNGITKQLKNGEGNYDSWPTKAKIREFKKRAGRLITIPEYFNVIKQLLRPQAAGRQKCG